MIGYLITPRGKELVEAYVTGVDMLWVPGVNYDRLKHMALTLNKLAFNTEDGYFAVDTDSASEKTLQALRALEIDEYVVRSPVPAVENYLKRQEYLKKHPGRGFLFGLED